LKGKVVYVDFWASWCTPCLRSMPALRTLYGNHKDQGFVVIGVNKDVSGAEAERFLRRFPVSFPLVADADDAVAKAFDVKTMPSGYLIDRSGVVRQVLRGFTAETETALALAARLPRSPRHGARPLRARACARQDLCVEGGGEWRWRCRRGRLWLQLNRRRSRARRWPR
jgi:peroxiredoxin